MLRILKIFLAGFCILVLAIVLPILAYGGWAAWALGFPHVSRNEVYAHQVMQDLSPDHVISVCGKPASDVVVDYGDRKSRILVYRDFEANSSLKEGHWQYDFMKDGNEPMPDARMVKRYAPIKLPCEP